MGITPAAIKALVEGSLENFVAAATPGGIEEKQAKGQRDMIASLRFPRNLRGSSARFDEDAADEYEALGFTFDRGGSDTVLMGCTLPAGWSMRATDHSMWFDVIDETGKIRVRVFYKAAFYDREAHATLERPTPQEGTHAQETP